MPNPKEPTPAEAGTTYSSTDGVEWKVAPSCGGSNGRWRCTTHPDVGLAHNMAKDLHCTDVDGPHVLAWHCLEHGPEVP